MGKVIKLDLPPADNLFSTQEERDDLKREKVVDIPLSLIDAFPGHPFHVTIDDEMMRLADSVKAYGVQVPAILRAKEDGRYELVSGHRRHKASEIVYRPGFCGQLYFHPTEPFRASTPSLYHISSISIGVFQLLYSQINSLLCQFTHLAVSRVNCSRRSQGPLFQMSSAL